MIDLQCCDRINKFLNKALYAGKSWNDTGTTKESRKRMNTLSIKLYKAG